MRYIVPNPAKWAPILAELRQALSDAEDAYAEYLEPRPSGRRQMVAAIAADIEIFDEEGTLGEDKPSDQDAALERVKSAYVALKKAEIDARQGRLFPEGPSAPSRASMVSEAEIARAHAALERSDATFRQSMSERSAAAEAQRRWEQHLRVKVEGILRYAGKSGVLTPTSRGLYTWGGHTWTLEQWTVALIESETLRDALESESVEARRRLEVRMAAEAREREAEARRTKAQAAKRPLPAGYTVEKVRGGYQVFSKDDMIGRRATKGDAVSLALEHHAARRRR